MGIEFSVYGVRTKWLEIFKKAHGHLLLCGVKNLKLLRAAADSFFISK